MTPNQRALTPRGLEQVFRPQGFAGNPQVHYVDRPWSDGMGFVRRAYRGVTWLFPLRFRANKFLVIFEKQAG
jgi:hypothetical protein